MAAVAVVVAAVAVVVAAVVAAVAVVVAAVVAAVVVVVVVAAVVVVVVVVVAGLPVVYSLTISRATWLKLTVGTISGILDGEVGQLRRAEVVDKCFFRSAPDATRDDPRPKNPISIMRAR